MTRENRPIEVAVVGGGCASLAAAWELSRPEHRGRYRVTVYQVGWRLGGKAANARGPADRIEEHGLHVWHGFYENAFQMLRECYAELDRDPRRDRYASWRDAFYTDPNVGTARRTGDAKWRFWNLVFPQRPGEPGDPLDRFNPFAVSSYLVQAAELALRVLESIREQSGGEQERDHPAAGKGRASPSADLRRLARAGRLLTLADSIEAARALRSTLALLPGGSDGSLDRLLGRLADAAAERITRLTEDDPELERLWLVLDLVLSAIRGAVRFGLATDPRGFDAINGYDLREWLELNGATARALESEFLRSLYGLCFAYEDGDPRRPRLAAGEALRTVARMCFSYRGAFFFKFRSGMGELVIAPLYQALRRRGVRFDFFHRLENVGLAPADKLAQGERPWVESLRFDVQAEVRDGAEYDPLIDVGGVACWPSEPDWRQIVGGDRLRRQGRRLECHWDTRRVANRELRVGEDFDLVVLGVSLGAVPFVCREILARDPRWRAMVRNVKTVATHALQLWLTRDLEELGWNGEPSNLILGDSYTAWMDGTRLIAEESWPVAPRSLAYFCGVLPTPADSPPRDDRGHPDRERERVKHRYLRFLRDELTELWPAARRPDGDFRWEWICDPRREKSAAAGSRDESRFDTQYWTANVNPSDRYVLSLPGSHSFRISPLDNSYDNLTLAGDWTDCGFNIGCVESAVMSGRLAAHALTGAPSLSDIVGYDHP